MKNKTLHICSLFDGLTRCILICLLVDYIGSTYCDSFTSTKQYYMTAILFTSVVFVIHFIFAVTEKSLKGTIEFSLFSILWCNIFKTVMILLRLFVSINIFPQKEMFYGEAFDQIIVLGISHILFAAYVLLLWLLVLIYCKLIKKKST